MVAAAPSPEQITAVIRAIREELAGHGSIEVWVDGLEVPVDVWRKAARRAGRELGRPVRTYSGEHLVVAQVADWPANEAEQAVHDAAMMAAAEAVALHIEREVAPPRR